jgi:hypothetical protein
MELEGAASCKAGGCPSSVNKKPLRDARAFCYFAASVAGFISVGFVSEETVGVGFGLVGVGIGVVWSVIFFLSL